MSRRLRPIAARRPAPGVPLAVDGPLELGLVHLRAALDAPVLGLLVELIAGASARSLVRAEAAAPPRRDVVGGRLARRLRLAGSGPLLVDRARRDLLSLLLAGPAVLEALLDVLVL